MPHTDAAAGSNGAEARAGNNPIQGWAEALVKTLHGCPSVEEAVQRCSRALSDVEAAVRQTTINEFDAAEARQNEELQAAQNKGRVLMRAVHHLAERCRRLEGGNEELVHLRQALEQSQEEQRRVSHSNEILMSHLRLHLGDGSDNILPWGNAAH